MDFPENVRYTREHEWITVEGGVGTIGITDYAQSELGDIVFVELPPVGTSVTKGQRFGTVEAVKAVSDLYAPVTGTVTEVNAALERSSEVINSEPYGGGWMIKVKLSNPDELSELLDVSSYKSLVGK